MSPAMGDRGRYVYAVCRGLDSGVLAGVPALGDGPLETIEALDLQGVVSTVDLDEFGEKGLRNNLEKPGWLERTARRHDAVVQACARNAPTAPMRLATICFDDWTVRRRLELRYDALAAALARIDGRQEWSVKVYAHSALAPTSDEARAVAAAREVDETLRGLAVATRRLRAPDPRLPGVGESMLLSGTYLVDEPQAAAFVEQVATLAAAHTEVSVACGGPWPPYSFAMLEEL
jgi:hypothetical protein